MGRTAVAAGQSFLVGAVALLTILAAHTLATYGRYQRLLAKLFDHRVRVLVHRGRVRRRQLLLCGLTANDLFSQLRQMGHGDVVRLRYVLYETKGELTVVPEDGAPGDPPLVAAGLRDAAGFDGTEAPRALERSST